jgi:hypothetical protein
MTLRSDYGGALDTALLTAKAAGVTLITTNLATISTEMQNAAAQGKKTFTVTLVVSFQPDDLKLEGNLWSAYSSGVESQLIAEEVYSNEVSVTLNVSDTNQLQLDLNFTF